MSKDFVFIENGLVKYEDYSRLIDKCEKAWKDNRIKDKEIERLKSIIKEAREKLEYYRTLQYGKYDSDEIISGFEGILDKVEEKKRKKK